MIIIDIRITRKAKRTRTNFNVLAAHSIICTVNISSEQYYIGEGDIPDLKNKVFNLLKNDLEEVISQS